MHEPIYFWFFLIFDVIGIFCSVFALYHLLKEKNLRKAIHNHTTIVILLINFFYQLFDIPLHIQYFNTGISRPSTPTFCLFWRFTDYGLFFIDFVLVMWASLERHILIFHSWMVSTTVKRALVHYLPLALIVLSMLIFYGVAVFAPPCENVFDYTRDMCGMAGCYGSLPSFGLIERIGFSILPTFLISLFCLALLARIIYQKARRNRAGEWKKHRKLVIHIVSLAFLYMCFDFPVSIINLVQLCCQPNWANSIISILFYYSYFLILLLPIVCIGSLPELRNKMKSLDPRRR